MKNYLKKFSIMFVMSLILVLGCCTSVFATDDGVKGTTNLNGTTNNSAKVGDVLKLPEKGWIRCDDTNSKINYTGNIRPVNYSQCYEKTYLLSNNATITDDCISFKFYGTQIRIIGTMYDKRSKNICIEIDGVKYRYDEWLNNSSGSWQKLVFEKLSLANSVHSVKIFADAETSIATGAAIYAFDIDAIDINKDGYLVDPDESISLNKSTDSLQIGETDNLVATTTPASVGVTWASSDTSVATVDVDSTNGKLIKVNALKEGTCTITATATDGSYLSASCAVNVTTSAGVVLNIEPEKSNIKLNETVTANLTIDNIKDIAAEDIRIKYDSSRLKFVNWDETSGIKLVKDDTQNGELRFILASECLTNVVNDKKILLKLKFQGIASGDALVDVTKGRVSDGITMEKDLTDEQCGQAIITIDDTPLPLADVNKSGEYTLLDLAIDARHLGEDPATLSQYSTDQVINGKIDDDDLLAIGQYMLANGNYSPNV